MVGIMVAVSPEQTSHVRGAARAVAGYDGGALPDTYGMKAAELAALMNAWRDRSAKLT
jgi:hypothetical protein